jgi:hypothetical protein
MDHKRGGKTGAATTLKVISLLMVLLLLVALGVYWTKTLTPTPRAWTPAAPEQRFFLPAAGSSHKIVHFPAYSMAIDSTGTAIWAACEYDARMKDAFTIPDSLFPALLRDDLQHWKEWQKKGQGAALRLGRVFVVTGPLTEGGSSFVAWLDEGFKKLEAAGVLLPQQAVVSIDSIEALTGLDLFAAYWLDSLENQVEKTVNLDHWRPEIP